jgi:tetratricopeptide (TPR) repeat protein
MNNRWSVGFAIVAICLSVCCPSPASADEGPVRIAEEKIVLPTYGVGPADPNPMFYTNESYQGAQKRIYPYALQDHLTYEKADKEYTSLVLENDYLELSVLPEIGGRLFSAVDKTNEYPFFYRQHVIKPALIGMLGAWISGGVEWCTFHHHRNTTYMPIDYTLAENPDGSKTIWFGETERRHRMKWLIGLTLYPDKSYMETTVKFFNRTAQPHSVLNWANVAVHANDDYQVIFPPSVQVATYHSKIDFTHWPIGQGKYRGHDYSGMDISWWKNSPVANSFFAWNLQEDFMGGYDHGREAGVVHVGNHHIVCCAKLWEWGTGEFGQAWDKILTDEDGPYAELMVGAYSDNQPDYSWIKPHEVKTFKQYWYPIRGIGGFKYANLNGAANLELKDGKATFGFCTTSKYDSAKATLLVKGDVVFEKSISIDPANPFTQTVSVPKGTKETDLRIWLTEPQLGVNWSVDLIDYQPKDLDPVEQLPAKVKPPAKPEDIKTTEELYLTGLRVEQIHNPTIDPRDYYREALKRDAGDSRCNKTLGIDANKRGLYAEAEKYLRTAIERVSAEYTRPRDAEVLYQLGIALRGQHKDDEAYDAFYRATWDQAYYSAAYYQLAEISTSRGDFETAHGQLERTLRTNVNDTRAFGLNAGVMRRIHGGARAEASALFALKTDPLDVRAMYELHLAQKDQNEDDAAQKTLDRMIKTMRGDVQAYLELASDYFSAGRWWDAADVLRLPIDRKIPSVVDYPMLHYYLGYAFEQQSDMKRALASYKTAAALPTDYCFPFRLEGLNVLNAALAVNPKDARAYYYLGNLLFDLQPDQAIAYWEKSRELDDSLAIVHRNLGWAYYRVKDNVPGAIACYEKALACDKHDPRLFLELDKLYEVGNTSPEKRLAALEPNHEVVVRRQDSFQREIMALILMGKYDSAIDYLENNFFHPQEGRNEIHNIFVDAHLLEGLRRLKAGRAREALAHFLRADEYPEHLSVGRPKNDPRAAQVAYFTANAYAALGENEKAKEFYRKAADQKETSRPEGPFYRAMSLRELGQANAARELFGELVATGQRQLEEGESADFFAKFGEKQTRQAQTAAAQFLLGLGFRGQGQAEESQKAFEQAAAMNLANPWAAYCAKRRMGQSVPNKDR